MASRTSPNTAHLTTFLRYSVFWRTADATHGCRTSFRQQDHRLHQPCGVLAKTFPSGRRVQEILKGSGQSEAYGSGICPHACGHLLCDRSLVVYAIFLPRSVALPFLEGVQWLAGPLSTIKVTGRAGISQARKRMGSEPLKQLHDAIVRPLATTRTQGARYREWRLVSLDGSTLDVADTAANTAAFGKASGPRGPAGYPRDPLCLSDRERNSCLVRLPDGRLRHIRNMRWRNK